jgi:hypothetical protein
VAKSGRAAKKAGIRTLRWPVNRSRCDAACRCLEAPQYLLGLSAFDLLFAAAFGFAFGSCWPIFALLALTVNRLAGFIFTRPPDGGQLTVILLGWAASVVAYLGGTFLTLIVPVPPFGITSEIVRMQEITATGIWPEEPWRLIAFGFLYFTLVGLWELFAAGVASRAKAISAARLS